MCIVHIDRVRRRTDRPRVRRSVRRAETGDVPDPADRCTAIPRGCPGLADEDGCPDVSLTLGPRCDLSGRNADTLHEIAEDMKKEKRLSTLGIVASDGECAALVTQKLVEAGVAASRVQSRLTRARGLDLDVYFEVIAWEGKRCGG